MVRACQRQHAGGLPASRPRQRQPHRSSTGEFRGADLFRQRAIGRYTAPQSDTEKNGKGKKAEDGSAGADAEGAGDGGETPSSESDLEQAAGLYHRVLDQAEAPTVYRVNALLGLGAVAESRKAWDQAAKYYDQAAELAKDQLPFLAQQAQERRNLLSQLNQEIVFATQPATAPLVPQTDSFLSPAQLPGSTATRPSDGPAPAAPEASQPGSTAPPAPATMPGSSPASKDAGSAGADRPTSAGNTE